MTSDIMLVPGESALATVSTQDLREQLASALTMTARHLVHVAAIWQELERRGEDMSGLRSGLFHYMPLIASGQVRAELVVRYAGFLTLLKRIADLPLAIQDTLIADDTVTIVDHDGSEYRERRVPLMRLKAAQIGQVVDHGIVSPEDQRKTLERQQRRLRVRPALHPKSAIDQLMTVIEQRPGYASGRKRVPLALSLTPEEDQALDAHCEVLGISKARLITGMLENAGMLKAPD